MHALSLKYHNNNRKQQFYLWPPKPAIMKKLQDGCDCHYPAITANPCSSTPINNLHHIYLASIFSAA